MKDLGLGDQAVAVARHPPPPKSANFCQLFGGAPTFHSVARKCSNPNTVVARAGEAYLKEGIRHQTPIRTNLLETKFALVALNKLKNFVHDHLGLFVLDHRLIVHDRIALLPEGRVVNVQFFSEESDHA